MKKIIKLLFLVIFLFMVVSIGLIFYPKQVSVAYTSADLTSYLAKSGTIIRENSASVEDIIFGNYKSIGVNAVDDMITSAEATAIVNEVSNSQSLLKDIRIKFVGQDKVSASAKIDADMSKVYEIFPAVKPFESVINTIVGRTLYVEADLVQGVGNSFEAMLTSVSVGALPIPIDQANEYGTQLGTFMNELVGKIEGFNMETFFIDESGLHFKGTIPAEIQSLGEQVHP